MPVEAEGQLRRQFRCTGALQNRAATRKRPVDRRGDQGRDDSGGGAWLATDDPACDVDCLEDSAEQEPPLIQRVVQIKEYGAPRSDRSDYVREPDLGRVCVVEHPERIRPIDRVLS